MVVPPLHDWLLPHPNFASHRETSQPSSYKAQSQHYKVDICSEGQTDILLE